MSTHIKNKRIMQVRNLVSAMCFQCIEELKMQMRVKGLKQLSFTNTDILGLLNLDYDRFIVFGQSWEKVTRRCRGLFFYNGDLVAYVPNYWNDSMVIESKAEIDEEYITKMEDDGSADDFVWLGLSENYDETDIFSVYDAAESVLRTLPDHPNFD